MRSITLLALLFLVGCDKGSPTAPTNSARDRLQEILRTGRDPNALAFIPPTLSEYRASVRRSGLRRFRVNEVCVFRIAQDGSVRLSQVEADGIRDGIRIASRAIGFPINNVRVYDEPYGRSCAGHGPRNNRLIVQAWRRSASGYPGCDIDFHGGCMSWRHRYTFRSGWHVVGPEVIINAGSAGNRRDAETLMIHEMGHVYGFNHVQFERSVMRFGGIYQDGFQDWEKDLWSDIY